MVSIPDANTHYPGAHNLQLCAWSRRSDADDTSVTFNSHLLGTINVKQHSVSQVIAIFYRTSAGGIVIPDSATEKPMTGEVLAVGNGKRQDNGERLTPDVNVGDKVLFGKYSGTEVKVEGEEVLVMREDDIMGVIEG